MLAVLWMRDPDSNKKFVLQENDPGEIQWEQFSLPELKNFLLILDREEAWYKRRYKEINISFSFVKLKVNSSVSRVSEKKKNLKTP